MKLAIIIKLKSNSSIINNVFFKSDVIEEYGQRLYTRIIYLRKYGLLLTENIIPDSYHHLVYAMSILYIQY